MFPATFAHIMVANSGGHCIFIFFYLDAIYLILDQDSFGY